jgi:hypothetical protein
MRSDTICYDLCLRQLCISIAGKEAVLFVTRVLPVDNIPASFIAQHPALRPLAAHNPALRPRSNGLAGLEQVAAEEPNVMYIEIPHATIAFLTDRIAAGA